jgi:hypothetical protein
MSDTNPSSQMPSMRLIFEYDGDNIRLVMQQPVDVPPPRACRRPGVRVFRRYAGRRGPHWPACAPRRLPTAPKCSPSGMASLSRAGRRSAAWRVHRHRPTPQDADHVRVVELTPAEPGVALTEARTIVRPPGTPEERELARFPLQIRR